MLKKMTMVIIAAILSLGAAVCLAEPPGGTGGPLPKGAGPMAGGENSPEKQEYREKLRRRAETMMIFFVADEIGLPADREDEFADLMRGHFKEINDLDRKEMEYKREIARQLKSEEDGSKDLERNLKELDALRDKRTESDKKLKENLKGILTVEQQAKFEMAVPKAREEILKKLQEAKKKGGKGMDGPGEPGAEGSGPPKGKKGATGPKSKFKD